MQRRSKTTRRRFLAAGAAMLATPAISQVKGPFDSLGPDADPNDLIDQIWDPETQRFISVRDLIDRLVDAPIILVGERHGFAPHQNREAFLLQALADRGRYPTLALEMLEPAQEPIIEEYRARNPEYARGLGIALDWANTGWPDWSFYEPVFDAAFAGKLDIVGADLSRSEQRELDQSTFDGPLGSAEVHASWKASLMEVYCGLIDEAQADLLANKQIRRDEVMANRVSSNSTDGGAILICGREHTRPERSVPFYLTDTYLGVDFVPREAIQDGRFSWISPAPEEQRSLLCG